MPHYEFSCIDRIFLNSVNSISRKEISTEGNLIDFIFERHCSL